MRFIRHPFKRALGRLFGDSSRNPLVHWERLSKTDWEFEWQRTYWSDLWRRPDVRAKCHEYWVRHRHLEDVLVRVRVDTATRVLDVGCGLSSVLHWVPGQRVGVDPLAPRYRTLWEYPFPVVAAWGESLPFADGAFDLVFCSNCIDHATDPEATMAEIARVMAPGGRFVLTCEVFAVDPGVRNPAHPHSMTRESLCKLAERAHFKVVEQWDSPWYGLRNWSLGNPPTENCEAILLLAGLGSPT